MGGRVRCKRPAQQNRKRRQKTHNEKINITANNKMKKFQHGSAPIGVLFGFLLAEQREAAVGERNETTQLLKRGVAKIRQPIAHQRKVTRLKLGGK
jgi:hypothetical protein